MPINQVAAEFAHNFRGFANQFRASSKNQELLELSPQCSVSDVLPDGNYGRALVTKKNSPPVAFCANPELAEKSVEGIMLKLNNDATVLLDMVLLKAKSLACVRTGATKELANGVIDVSAMNNVEITSVDLDNAIKFYIANSGKRKIVGFHSIIERDKL